MISIPVPGITFYTCDHYKEKNINVRVEESGVNKGLEGCFAGMLDTTYFSSIGLALC